VRQRIIIIPPSRSQVACWENDSLAEIHIERASSAASLAINLQRESSTGASGMQAAFVEMAWRKPGSSTFRTCSVVQLPSGLFEDEEHDLSSSEDVPEEDHLEEDPPATSETTARTSGRGRHERLSPHSAGRAESKEPRNSGPSH